MSFAILTVRPETAAGKPAGSIRVGRSVLLAVRVQVKNVNSALSARREWRVTHLVELVGYHSVAGVPASSASRTYRWSWTFNPHDKGKYAITVRVAVGAQTATRSAAFAVQE